MKKWLADHGLELVSVAAAVGGSIVALAQQVTAMAQSNPWAFAFWTVAALGLGFLMGTRASERSSLRVKLAHEAEQAALDRESAERIASKEVEAERVRDQVMRDEERAEADERRERMARRVTELPDAMKHHLWTARKDGYLEVDHSDTAASALGAKGMLADITRSAGFKTKWVLTDEAAAAMDDSAVRSSVNCGYQRHERVLRERRLDCAEDEFRGLHFGQRLLAYTVYRLGPRDIGTGEEYDNGSGFLDVVDIGGGMRRVSLTKEAGELFDKRYSSCFDDIEDQIEPDDFVS